MNGALPNNRFIFYPFVHVVGKLQERVDGIDVKLTSLINVVKLLQRYTETKDDQYEKERENVQIYQGKKISPDF